MTNKIFKLAVHPIYYFKPSAFVVLTIQQTILNFFTFSHNTLKSIIDIIHLLVFIQFYFYWNKYSFEKHIVDRTEIPKQFIKNSFMTN